MEKLIASLKIALEMERMGYDIYMNAAKKTKNKLGRETLEAIARKELDHMEAIKMFSRKLGGGSIDIESAIKAIGPMGKKAYILLIMEKLQSELDKKMKPDSDLEKAYEAAMGLEREAYDFYKKLAGEAGDKETKKFFEFLIKEENIHYELLQETLEYLNRPGDWFKEKERWVIEG
ncbi:MAG: ferritin family protein [Candidatus Saganbacteria bacterium]|nr:ferritin family protein [Candidatus Saganbacteria bacterium]